MTNELIEQEIYKNNIDNDNILLSIISPVYKNSAKELLNSLLIEINNNNLNTEIIIVDDGSNCENLSNEIKSFIDRFNVCAKLITLKTNGGRAYARNQLIDNSKGEYLLFLDSDMLPDSDKFVQNWIDFIIKTEPTIGCGGFTVNQIKINNDNRLAYEVAKSTDCINAELRTERGALAVATSNLLVRRDITKKVPFDCSFIGWGWEDVEWALRANKNNYAIVHIDNGATHLGLDNIDTLLLKYKNAGPNFKKICDIYPEMLSLKGTRAAQFIAKNKFLDNLIYIIPNLLKSKFVPIIFKIRLLKIWRAIYSAKSLRD